MSTEDKSMNECTVLPEFKRNNYFYGKLLSVKDFQQEQQYFINKLRLMNRLIHGVGIVCGLKVTKGNAAGVIEVGEGFALDFCGREIVLRTKVKCDIDQMYKTTEFKNKTHLFVTIKYDETPVDPVPVLESAETNSAETETKFSMILEGAKVEVAKLPPTVASEAKLFLAKLTVKKQGRKILVEKIEDSALVHGTKLERITVG